MSYELLAVDRRLLAEEALDAVRGHLHDHGIDVELADVVGGAVYVRLHGLARQRRRDSRPSATIWRRRSGTGLIGFQELVVGDRATAPARGLLQVGVCDAPSAPCTGASARHPTSRARR